MQNCFLIVQLVDLSLKARDQKEILLPFLNLKDAKDYFQTLEMLIIELHKLKPYPHVSINTNAINALNNFTSEKILFKYKSPISFDQKSHIF